MKILIALGLIMLVLMAGLWLFTAFTAKRVEAGLPPEGRFVDVMGSRLHVIEAGQGPAILLIHGLGGVARNFNYQVLHELAKEYRVVAVDRPGSGYSTRHRRSYAGLDVQADVMAGLIQALQMDRPLLVGHSLGGAVALATALRHPNEVSGLALIAPLTHMPQDVPKAFAGMTIRQGWLRRLIAWTVATPLTILNREKVMDIVFGPEQVPSDFDVRGGGFLALRPSQFIASSRDLAALEDVLPMMQQRYADLQLPISVLYGRQDRILDPTEQGQGLTDAVSQAQLQLVDGGHMLPVTQPELTTDFIRGVHRRIAASP